MSADRTTHTFWKLIESCNVIVPKLQRDYAQGREHDPAIEQIRNSLIDEIYSSVTENKALVLNFIMEKKTMISLSLLMDSKDLQHCFSFIGMSSKNLDLRMAWSA